MTVRISILICLLVITNNCINEKAEQEPKPNVVIILADDLGTGDISLYDGWVNTPAIDQMAGEGVKFTDFHSNSSVCSPSRTALLTGCYQQRFGIVDVIVGYKDERGLAPSATTIAEIMKEAGYKTAIFGKWHCGTDTIFNPLNQGFDEFTGFLTGGCDYHNHQDWWDGGLHLFRFAQQRDADISGPRDD